MAVKMFSQTRSLLVAGSGMGSGWGGGGGGSIMNHGLNFCTFRNRVTF